MDADSPQLYDRLETTTKEILTSTEWPLTETPDGYRIIQSKRTAYDYSTRRAHRHT